MIYNKYISTFLLLILGSLRISSQDVNLLQGDHAFDLKHYNEAIELYSKYGALGADKFTLEKRGLSYFYIHQFNKAISDFTKSKRLGNENHDLYFYMAKCKQLLGAFDEAAFFYIQYLQEADDEKALYYEAQRELKNCAYAATHLKESDDVLIQTFDGEVNSQYDEINVVQSPRFGNRYYVSTNRNKNDFEILDFSLNNKGIWEANNDSPKPYNNGSNNILADIDNKDGSALLHIEYITDSDKVASSFNTFDKAGNEINILLPQEIFETAIDIQIVNPNLLAFSDYRPNGYGGYDIYTVRYENGQWGKPINAGAQINSNFDERCPFFSADLEHLYFSSNKPYAYGGYDIYYAKNTNYISLQNLGAPINSPADELFWRLDNEGHMATFSSNRPGGKGGYDLYFAYLQNIKSTYYKDSLSFEYVIDNIPKQDSILSDNDRKIPIEDISTNDYIERDRDNDEEALNQTNLAEATVDSVSSFESAKNKEALIVKSLHADSTLNFQEKDTSDSNTIIPKKDTVDSPDTISQKSFEAIVPANYEVDTLENLIKEVPVNKVESTIETDEVALKLRPSPLPYPFTLFYQDKHDLTAEENKIKLDYLIDQFKRLDYIIKIQSHTDFLEPGLVEYVQYNCLKRAISVAEYLIENGIEPEKIMLESVAANYPLARAEVAGKPNNDKIYINKRVDLEVVCNDQRFKDELIQSPLLESYEKSPKYEIFKSIHDEIYYSVEINQTPRIFKNAILRLYNDIFIHRDLTQKRNHYMIGLYTQYEDALFLKKELDSSSAPYAKVVAFFRGEKINASNLNNYISDFPELSKLKF